MGVGSHIGLQFVLKILLGVEGGRSHKTSWSHNRGSYNAGTTVCAKKTQEQKPAQHTAIIVIERKEEG